MNIAKRILALFIAVVASATGAMAQTDAAKQELSVEESYLQESIEVMVIREQSRAESRDMKLVALEYIGDAIEAGRGSEEIQKALEYMALEGVLNKSREGGLGRVTNNYPDVRAKAAAYLGELGGEAAKDSLLKIVLADPEPMVLTEAIKSLSKIGLNENDETATTISWIVTRFDILNPDNTLALAALDAFEALAAKNGGIKDASSIRTIMRIAEGPYIRPVQARARDVLSKLRQYGAQKK
ncbi:MAG TPA: HEAT repeat domain-containing protein [Treponema sp.]|nr:MAG: hypothetical protein A2001_13570 [Treponema sp. GWC1_61_84]OHE71078.1 MAG: hypothetical protein A2413_17110 [Treponema sp. RIFOXYC1_FULL_61_9]HCM27150.1 HEAT repeat domain-containing protein [Treponema sp.]